VWCDNLLVLVLNYAKNKGLLALKKITTREDLIILFQRYVFLSLHLSSIQKKRTSSLSSFVFYPNEENILPIRGTKSFILILSFQPFRFF
jgi:hypothetical protein